MFQQIRHGHQKPYVLSCNLSNRCNCTTAQHCLLYLPVKGMKLHDEWKQLERGPVLGVTKPFITPAKMSRRRSAPGWYKYATLHLAVVTQEEVIQWTSVSLPGNRDEVFVSTQRRGKRMAWSTSFNRMCSWERRTHAFPLRAAGSIQKHVKPINSAPGSHKLYFVHRQDVSVAGITCSLVQSYAIFCHVSRSHPYPFAKSGVRRRKRSLWLVSTMGARRTVMWA